MGPSPEAGGAAPGDRAASAETDSLRRRLRRAEALSRLRGRLLGYRGLEELRTELRRDWLAELQALGVPAAALSLQWPSSSTTHYETHGGLLFHGPDPARHLLARCPWVQQAWDTGRPVRVDRQTMRQAGYGAGAGVILEVPLQGGGSLGLSSPDPEAFTEVQIDTVVALSAPIPEAIERVAELEALEGARQSLRVDLALQRVRGEVLKMSAAEDWEKVVHSVADALRSLVDFWSFSINLVDLQGDTLTAFGVDGEGGLERHLIEGVHPAVRQAVTTGAPVYRRTRRDPLFDPGFIPRLNSVLDVPFEGGTVAVNAEAEAAFSDEDIIVLSRFAEAVAEGHKRQQDLLAIRQREAQMHHGRVLESIGQLTTGVAHQLNNPLTSVIGYGQQLLRRADLDDSMRRDLQTIVDEGTRAHRIAEGLLAFARRQRGGRQHLDLNALVAETLALHAESAGTAAVTVEAALSPDLPPVEAQAGQLQQVLLALLDNAVVQPGVARVRVSTAPCPGGVRVEVADDGPGVPPALRRRVFDPFYSSRTQEGRVGLGLTMALRIAVDHGGRLWIEDPPDGTPGARFLLELPA